MKRIPRKIMLKGVIVVCMLAVITSCLVSTTFAALSATFTWTTDTVKSGDFDFTDQTFSLSLFNTEEIFQGDYGEEKLSGADFEDNSVSWTFKENNSNGIPIIYYVKTAEKKVSGLYSSYDYLTKIGANKYIKLADGRYVGCGSVSTDASVLVSALNIGATLCWIWPDKIYNKTGEEYVEDTASQRAKEFESRNAKLCKSNYVYDKALLSEVFRGVLRVAVSKIPEGYGIVQKADLSFTYENGKLKKMIRERNGVFGEYESIEKRDAYVFFVNKESVGEIMKIAGGAGYIEACGDYSEDVANKKMYKDTSKGELIRTLIKVYPKASEDRPSISVSIAATVFAR